MLKHMLLMCICGSLHKCKYPFNARIWNILRTRTFPKYELQTLLPHLIRTTSFCPKITDIHGIHSVCLLTNITILSSHDYYIEV